MVAPSAPGGSVYPLGFVIILAGVDEATPAQQSLHAWLNADLVACREGGDVQAQPAIFEATCAVVSAASALVLMQLCSQGAELSFATAEMPRVDAVETGVGPRAHWARKLGLIGESPRHRDKTSSVL
jgi:hypothetical protein